MADVFRRGRRLPTASLLLVVPLAGAVLAACGPTGDEGYAKVTHRRTPVVPRAAFPDPPPVMPGTSVGVQTAPVTLALDALPDGVTAEMVEAGQQLYAGGICMGCHGPQGTGSAIGPALNDTDWLHIGGTFPEIVQIITAGVANPRQFAGAMPPRGGGAFTDDEVRSLAAYIYALSHQEGG
jgi:mono/diheme cytochrome c family protein